MWRSELYKKYKYIMEECNYQHPTLVMLFLIIINNEQRLSYWRKYFQACAFKNPLTYFQLSCQAQGFDTNGRLNLSVVLSPIYRNFVFRGSLLSLVHNISKYLQTILQIFLLKSSCGKERLRYYRAFQQYLVHKWYMGNIFNSVKICICHKNLFILITL